MGKIGYSENEFEDYSWFMNSLDESDQEPTSSSDYYSSTQNNKFGCGPMFGCFISFLCFSALILNSSSSDWFFTQIFESPLIAIGITFLLTIPSVMFTFWLSNYGEKGQNPDEQSKSKREHIQHKNNGLFHRFAYCLRMMGKKQLSIMVIIAATCGILFCSIGFYRQHQIYIEKQEAECSYYDSLEKVLPVVSYRSTEFKDFVYNKQRHITVYSFTDTVIVIDHKEKKTINYDRAKISIWLPYKLGSSSRYLGPKRLYVWLYDNMETHRHAYENEITYMGCGWIYNRHTDWQYKHLFMTSDIHGEQYESKLKIVSAPNDTIWFDGRFGRYEYHFVAINIDHSDPDVNYTF